MAKITIEELSDSLKEYLGGLGLTEEQVNSLIKVEQLEDRIENLDVKMYYPIYAPQSFENFTPIELAIAPPGSSAYEFRGEMPVEVSGGSNYLARITFSDNNKAYALGEVTANHDDEIGRRVIMFSEILLAFEAGFDMTAGIFTNTKVSEDDPSDLVFEEDNNTIVLIYSTGINENLIPIKIEFLALPFDEIYDGVPESGEISELIIYLNSFFETKTVEMNEDFFKTHRFITQDIINNIGDLDCLTTSKSTNLVDAINAVDEYITKVSTDTIGYTGGLETNAKNLVGAINELFQNVDSGKQLIADAIDDENITKDSTFSAMSEAILGLKNSVEYATGDGSITFIVTSSESKTRNAILDKPFGFTPTHIILVFDNGVILTNKTTSDNPLELDEENYVYIDSMTSDTLTFNSFSGMRQYSHDFTYYAFNADSSSSGSGTGPNILSYETLELSSSDLFIPTNSGSDYYHYSLESYNDDDVYLVFADTKAMEDDIGYMQYYNSIYFYPDASAAPGSILLGYKGGDSADSVTQMSAHARIPIMKTTDRLLENKLVVLYRAGAVSNAFSQSLLNTEPANYQLVDYRTFNLDSLSFDFDYILFSLSVNNGDGDSSTIYSMYDRNSKKCCIIAYGYDTYSYKIDDVPSNAIPIFPTNRYSGLFVSYTGFVKNGNNIE